MKPRRNEPCPCGSGWKYKRCCIARDEAKEREELAARIQSNFDLSDLERRAEAGAAVISGLRMVAARDRVGLDGALNRFASILATDEALEALRFDPGAFARVVGGSLGVPGGTLASRARVRLFRVAISELGDRDTVQRFHDQIARALTATAVSQPDREALAAALLCLDPVLKSPALPAAESPTLEIIFVRQLEALIRGGRPGRDV